MFIKVASGWCLQNKAISITEAVLWTSVKWFLMFQWLVTAHIRSDAYFPIIL